jgi:hypothetical protein
MLPLISGSNGDDMRSAALVLLAAVLFAPLLAAQDAKEDKQVDLAVAFPSTTMVYLWADTNDYFEALNPKEIFAGLEGDLDIPDLGEIARDRLELNLSDAEVEALAKGVQGTAGGLLDVAVSGPKFEVVFKHKDLSALARALKEAKKAESSTVVDMEDYYGKPIYEIEVPVTAAETDGNPTRDINPFNQWLASDSLWVAVYDNKYLLLANSSNAVKDGVDFISYPDDPIDTLLGNSRYKEAIKSFEKPQGVFFVNVQSVINTIERLAGDKGSSGPMQEMLQAYLGTTDDDVRFVFNLLQYEQFKSFAAGFWLDEKALTLRMDANLVFHNPPGWFETLRIEPKEMPLTEFIPADSVLALTDCVDDVKGMYDKTREFFFSRAKAAGQVKMVEAWQKMEKMARDEHASLNDTLSHLGGGQALIVRPRQKSDWRFPPFDVAGILGVKDCRKAEDYFYEHLLQSRQGQGFKRMEGEISPIEIINGIEVHCDTTGAWGFAFIDGEDGAGVFVTGDMDALRAIARAKTEGDNLHSKKTWTQAKGLLWKQGSMHTYINVGSLISTLGGGIRGVMWMMEDDDPSTFNRDDTEKDDDPIPYLADFFKNTVIVGSTLSSDSSISIRVAAAGWPDRNSMRDMAIHYRDVARNQRVRDDLLRVRMAARDYLVIQGKPATTTGETVKAGYLARREWSVDPYGADEPDKTERNYALSEVPEDVDIRQAILCAYQSKPGLRGNFLAVLWNTHVVELTPDGLKEAIKLAKKGKPLPPDGKWYKELEKPLHEQDDPTRFETDSWEEDTRIEVTLINDQGEESTMKVKEEDLMTATEAALDAQDAESKD